MVLFVPPRHRQPSLSAAEPPRPLTGSKTRIGPRRSSKAALHADAGSIPGKGREAPRNGKWTTCGGRRFIAYPVRSGANHIWDRRGTATGRGGRRSGHVSGSVPRPDGSMTGRPPSSGFPADFRTTMRLRRASREDAVAGGRHVPQLRVEPGLEAGNAALALPVRCRSVPGSRPSVIAGTVMHGTHLPLRELVCRGLSDDDAFERHFALQLQAKLGLGQRQIGLAATGQAAPRHGRSRPPLAERSRSP